jgi:predicted acetyltransferase
MSIEIRPPIEEGPSRFFKTVSACFGGVATDEEIGQRAKILPMERALAAFDGDEMVGVTGAFQFDVTIPGGELPAGGVTVTGVLPTHRRRGILTAMMKQQLRDVHDWGEPVAILWASEGPIYGRYGYGLAVPEISIELERDRAAFKSPVDPRGRVRLLPRADAAKVMAEVYDRARTMIPGMLTRSTDWWESHTFADHDEQKDPPTFYAVLDLDDRAAAYAAYKVHPDWNLDGISIGWLEVIEEISTSPEAAVQIWRFLVGIDLIKTIKAMHLSVDHPLQHLLAESRRLRMGLKDAVWLRIVDIEEALVRRSYAAAGSLVIELEDDLCPWNTGRWKLDTSGDNATIESTDADADLKIGPSELGSIYLGGNTFGELLRSGFLEELQPGAAWRADGMFRTERKPWCPEIF